MLVEKYSLPEPEPRRLEKRISNLLIMTVRKTVADVYFFKQTSLVHDAGKPGKIYDPGDLWDVISKLHPSRELIIEAWKLSLEYSIGTSAIGINVMTSVTEYMGFEINKVFTMQRKALLTTRQSEFAINPSFLARLAAQRPP